MLLIKTDQIMPTRPSAKLSPEEFAVLRTVLYSSLFDYPLTLKELRCNLLESAQDASSLWRRYHSSPVLQGLIEVREGYFFPRGRSDLPERRRHREAKSRAILEANRKVLKLICSIPYTRLVALSGSAAHLNLDGKGDIDLFIVTKGKTVWSVAMSILLLTKLFGRRKMVCFNFVISDERLKVECQDLFTANQVIHLKPLIGHKLCQRLIDINNCVSGFYPNFKMTAEGDKNYNPGFVLRSLKRAVECVLRPGLSLLQEHLSRALYSRYLLRRSSSWTTPHEVVLEKDYLKLHTHSHRHRVMDRFEHAVADALEQIHQVKTGSLK